MEIYLGDFAGRQLKTFEGGQDELPCFGNYLKFNGLHLSRCTFYLMTKRKISSLDDLVTNMQSDSEQSLRSDNSEPNITTSKPQSTVVPLDRDVSLPIIDLDEYLSRKSGTNSKLKLLPVDLHGLVRENQIINVQYFRETLSAYTDEISLLKCNSITQCRDFSSFDTPLDEENLYMPCQNGFQVSEIEIEGNRFLETRFDNDAGVLKRCCRYPSSKDREHGMIIHDPCEIWGYDEDNLMLGIVVGYTENVQYEWYKDNTPIASGASLNLIVIKDPGLYTCQVTYADIKQMSKPIHVLSVEQADRIPSTRGILMDVTPSTSTSIAVNERETNNGQSREEQSCQHLSAMGQPCFAVPEVDVKDINIDYSAKLGSGAFGVVYKGNWTGSDVAVKSLAINKRTKKAMLRLVEQEITVSSKLRHPNIVQFMAVARTATDVYLVHEFINGCNMEDAIFDAATKLDMAITPDRKLFIVRQCVLGVSYLHALVPKVLHQDIKPSNVLIKKGCLTTKICDLGVSRFKSVAAATTTAFGTGCGSPPYMAPEVLLHGRKTSQASDIWSLGLTLVEFVTEKDAWSVDDEADVVPVIMEKMRKQVSPLPEPVPPHPGVPSELMGFLKRCVDYDDKARPDVKEITQYLSSLDNPLAT